MAVTPLTNPISATPLTSSTSDAVENRVEEQRAALTPENIGEQLQQQVRDAEARATAAESAALQAQSQSREQIQALSQQIAEMRGAMSVAPAPAAAVEQAPDYSYTEAELQEMGQALPGAIDKRALAAATQMRDDAVRLANEQSAAQITALQNEINKLRTDVTSTQDNQNKHFESQAIAAAAFHGLEVSSLAQDKDWAAMMGEVADPIAGTTYGQYYDHAYAQKDPAMMGQLFQAFGNRQKAAQAAAAPPAPQPGGGAARQVASSDPVGSAELELQNIQETRNSINDLRQRRQISAADYAKQITELDTRLANLQASLTKT